MTQITLQDRMRGAIWGQFVGDAACLGTHWIYDLEELNNRYPEIHGFERPYANHYHAGKEPGELTHYGEAALLLLESIVKNKGFSPVAFGTEFIETFAFPNYQGYLDQSTRGTIENYRYFQEEHPDEQFNYQEGANDDQMATATRIAPAIIAYWNNPKLLHIIESVTRTTQNNGTAIIYMRCHARIVHNLLEGKDFLNIVNEESKIPPHESPIEDHMRTTLQEALSFLPISTTEATKRLGQGCSLTKSFPSALQAALKYQNSFQDAIIATIKAGGDNAGRAALIGTWLGASLGIQAIPQQWLKQLTNHSHLHNLIESLIKLT